MKLHPFAVLAALACLAGCGGDPKPAPVAAIVPTIKVVETKVAVPVPCVPFDFPAAPTFTDTAAALKAAADQPARYDLLASNWEPKQKRLDALEAALAGCR